MRSLRWFGLLLALGMAFMLSGCQTLQNSKLLLPPDWTGMQAVQRDVWVEASLTDASRQEQVLVLYQRAQARLAAVVGEVQSRPIHVFCYTEACYQSFGGGSPRAKSFGSLRTLIGPRGLSEFTLAHEWWHTELHYRIGYFNRRRVPAWFDEGMAVWVSDDPRFDESVYQRILAAGINPPELSELETRSQFTAAIGRYGDHLRAVEANSDAMTVVYPTAAHEVRRWMKGAGLPGLHALIAGLARGEEFTRLYAELERSGHTTPVSGN